MPPPLPSEDYTEASLPDDPTSVAYGELQEAFGHFNDELFDGELPECLITLQRRRNTYGYFSASRFMEAAGIAQIDEIALNPQKWKYRTVEANLSTLAHEMVHLWQQHFGRPSRRGYHNREWAAKMLSIGLIPSHDGQPGGHQTGQRVSHYIAPDGRFARACRLGFDISFHDMSDERPRSERQNKTKFTCPTCGANAWGKPDLHIDCRDCQRPMDGTIQSREQAASAG